MGAEISLGKILVGGAVGGAVLTIPQFIEAILNYNQQGAMLGFQEKELQTKKQGMAQYIDYLKNSAETDYGRTLGLKREDRDYDRQNMLLAMMMQGRQNQQQMMMGLMQSMMQANRIPQIEPSAQYGPPSSLTSLLR